MTRQTIPAFRLFHGPDCIEDCTAPDSSVAAGAYTQEATVSMRLGDLVATLATALRGGYLWVDDFADDEVRVSEDFYQVLRAFEELRTLSQEVC